MRGGVGCCHSVRVSGGGVGREIVGYVVLCADVWVLLCLALVFMAFNTRANWGLSGRCFIVGVRWGESVGWCCGIGASVGEKRGYVRYVVRCDDVWVRYCSLMASLASLISGGCRGERWRSLCLFQFVARGVL